MNTVLHLARKDLARHWIPALLVIAAIAIDTLQVYTGFLGHLPKGIPAGIATSLFKWPLAFLFLVALVQEDRVIDSRAHWLTRPINPLALLSAKILSATAVVIGPQTVASGLLGLFVGGPGIDRVLAVFESFASALLLTLTTILIAALTRTIIESCLVVAAGLLTVILGLWAWMENKVELLKILPAPSGVTGGTHFVVTAVFIGTLLPVLLAWHYRRRSIGRTVLGAALLQASLIALLWLFPIEIFPTSKIPTNSVPMSATTGDVEPTRLRFQLAGPAVFSGAQIEFDGQTRTRVPARMVGVPMQVTPGRTDRIIRSISATTTLRLANGETKVYPVVTATHRELGTTSTLAEMLGLTLRATTADRPLLLMLLTLRPGDNPMPSTSPARAEVQLAFSEIGLVPLGRFPATAGFSFFAPHLYRSNGVQFVDRHNVALLPLRLLWIASLRRPDAERTTVAANGKLSVALIHPRLGEFCFGRASRGFNDADIGPGTVRALTAEFTFSERVNQQGVPSGRITREWLAEAELIVFAQQTLRRTTQTIELDRLSVDNDVPAEELRLL